MTCVECGTELNAVGNYCSECGTSVRARLLPAVLPERRLVKQPSHAVAPALARSITALVVGKAAEWVLRQVARRIVSTAVSRTRPVPPPAPVQQIASSPSTPALPRAIYSITTLIMHRVQVYDPPPEEPAPKPSRKLRLFRRG